MEENGNWKPNVLILGPGGVKGFLTIGSLLFFEKSKLLKEINKVVGISIGAVIGLFYTAGFSITEILEIALSTHLSDVFTSLDIINVMKKNGLVSHDILRKKMSEKIIQKYGFIPTLKQFYLMSGIEFEVVVTNLDDDKPEYFNYQTEPELSCVEAVLMSISLPLFFQSYVYKNKYYLDGGISDPFPVERYKNDKVFGIFLKGSPKDSKASFFDYLSRIVQVITSVQIKHMKIPSQCKILNLEHTVNDTIGMKMNFEQRVDLVFTGYVKAFEFYFVLHQKYPNTYPLQFIQRYHSIQLFQTFLSQNNKNILYEYQSEIESDAIEEEGDFYLQECFTTSSSDNIDSDEENQQEQENEEQEEEPEKEEQGEGDQEEGYQVEGDHQERQEDQPIIDEEKDKIHQIVEDVNEIRNQMDKLLIINNEIIMSPKRNKYLIDEDEPLIIDNLSSDKEDTFYHSKEDPPIVIYEEQRKEIDSREQKRENGNQKATEKPIDQEGKERGTKDQDGFYYNHQKKNKKKGKKRKHHKPEWIKK